MTPFSGFSSRKSLQIQDLPLSCRREMGQKVIKIRKSFTSPNLLSLRELQQKNFRRSRVNRYDFLSGRPIASAREACLKCSPLNLSRPSRTMRPCRAFSPFSPPPCCLSAPVALRTFDRRSLGRSSTQPPANWCRALPWVLTTSVKCCAAEIAKSAETFSNFGHVSALRVLGGYVFRCVNKTMHYLARSIVSVGFIPVLR